MSHLIWDSALNAGIEVIDGQHKRIVEFINLLDDAGGNGDRAAIGEIIEDMVDYTLSHFAFEESLMEEAGYAGAVRANMKALVEEKKEGGWLSSAMGKFFGR